MARTYYTYGMSRGKEGDHEKPPTAIIIIPAVFSVAPRVITTPIVTSSIGQLKITLSMKIGKNPVFLITENNPARTRITPIMTLLFEKVMLMLRKFRVSLIFIVRFHN